jgi:hypothetical protein
MHRVRAAKMVEIDLRRGGLCAVSLAGRAGARGPVDPVSINRNDWREKFQSFALAVSERLDAGERQYRGRTFELPASSIIAEAQAELLDNAAYSFIAWCRLERLRQELDRMRPPVGQEEL